MFLKSSYFFKYFIAFLHYILLPVNPLGFIKHRLQMEVVTTAGMTTLL
jgi:hypothetical protein